MAALMRLEADDREAGYDGLVPALSLNQKLVGLRLSGSLSDSSERIKAERAHNFKSKSR